MLFLYTLQQHFLSIFSDCPLTDLLYSVKMHLLQSHGAFVMFLGLEPMGKSLEQHYKNFISKCKAEKLDRDTIDDKIRFILMFISKYDEITVDNIYDFLNTVDVPWSTERKLRRDLRTFIKYLNEINVTIIPYTIIKSIKDRSGIRPMVLQSEYNKMIAKCDELISNPYNSRHQKALINGKNAYILWKAVIMFLWDTGLRVCEITNIKMSDIDFDKQTFFVEGKLKKWRQGFFECDLTEYLEEYKPEKYLFEISTKTATKITRELRKRCNIQRDITSHSFRHTYATDLIANGADIISVKDLCGHSSVATTQIYAHSLNLEKTYKKYRTRTTN